jgi:16S rRNA (adenine1518-N6/adenine1519-N6)-dimethyltransferase
VKDTKDTKDTEARRRRRLPPKRRYAQHFLAGPWADKVVEAIDPRPEDFFVEIGPGQGALTLRLAPRVAHVTAVEVDREMVRSLRPQLPSNVTLVEQDFLDADLAELTGLRPARVAGNLPYNVSSPILFRLLDAVRRDGNLFDATVMLQREVAERLEALPGTKDYGVLSIFVRLRADVRRVLTLPPGAFRPAPKVHSAVTRLTFRKPVRLADEQVFTEMVRSVFTQRRKTLANSLDAFASARGASATAALRASGIESTRRAETLQLAELARLADYFASTKSRAVL